MELEPVAISRSFQAHSCDDTTSCRLLCRYAVSGTVPYTSDKRSKDTGDTVKNQAVSDKPDLTDDTRAIDNASAVTTSIAEVATIPEPPQPPAGSVEDIVRQAARKYGLDENNFVRIAKCESSLNPNVVNYSYFENGNPSGLFQHLSGYWPARATQYGYAGASVFDATANANVTAAMWAEGQSYLWECKA